MIASAWLGLRASERKARWQALLERSAWILPFTVVAEMRFGAEVARWGARRREVLDRLISRAGVVPPLDSVTDAYVGLRTWTVRTGHGLGAKDHEADRWVAAVAMAAKLPLATEDSIFEEWRGSFARTPRISRRHAGVSTQVTDRTARLWDDGARWDAILTTLRAEGFTKVDCLKATVELLRLPVADAKRVVHDSHTWADVRGLDDEWHHSLVAELDASESRS